jgi:hypothetical protein
VPKDHINRSSSLSPHYKSPLDIISYHQKVSLLLTKQPMLMPGCL